MTVVSDVPHRGDMHLGCISSSVYMIFRLYIALVFIPDHK